MKHTEELLELTAQLLAWNEHTMQIFQKRTERETDFYTEVKPFVEKLDAAAEKWKETAELWISEEKPKYIHSVQIQQTYDNLQRSAVECFMPQTKEKRFNETHQAIEYVLNSILEF